MSDFKLARWETIPVAETIFFSPLDFALNSLIFPCSCVAIMFSSSRNTALRQVNAQLRFLRLSHSPTSPSSARFLSSLAILEQRDGKLQGSSLASVAAAQK